MLKTTPPHDEFSELLEYIGGTSADFPSAKAKRLDVSLPVKDSSKVKFTLPTGAAFIRRHENEWLQVVFKNFELDATMFTFEDEHLLCHEFDSASIRVYKVVPEICVIEGFETAKISISK